MAERRDWDAAQDEILRRLDIDARFASLGVRFTGKAPNASGWKACFARDREDAHASACCNVGDGEARGRYSDKGGVLLSLGFFEFAARFGGFKDWREARAHYGKEVGVSLPGGREPETIVDRCSWHVTIPATLRPWTKFKPPITAQACMMAGARMGEYPKGKYKPQAVVAFPVFGSHLTGSDPVNFVMYRQDGTDMELFRGKDTPPDKLRMMTLKGGGPGLLNAFALDHIREAEFVWKVEGPTDMLSAQSVIPHELLTKHVVIATGYGCAEAVQSWIVELLRGKNVILVGDCDKPGQLGVEKWRSYLRSWASSLRTVTLPYPIEEKHGKDLRDFLAEGHTYPTLLGMCSASEAVTVSYASTAPLAPAPATLFSPVLSVAPTPAPPAPAPAPVILAPVPPPVVGDPLSDIAHIEERDILARIQVHVLGHYPDSSIDIFAEATRQIHRINNIGRLSYAELLLYASTPARDNVTPTREPMPGKRTMDEVCRAIAIAGAGVNLIDAQPLGQGLWRIDGRNVIVCGGFASVAAPDHPEIMETVTVPRVGRQLIDFSHTEAWCDLAKLTEYVKCAVDPSFREAAIGELHDIMRKWPWRFPGDAEICTGLVCATWMQTAWPWRPIVAITGPTSTGKSSLLDSVLQRIYGKLATLFNKPSEAGIRQQVGTRSSVILVDEFESDYHRGRVLELFRTTSRGGEIYRGSSDQRGRRYGLRHIPWTAAIESGLTKEADRNRFIILDLTRLEGKRFGHLVLPSPLALADLGFRVLASVLVCAGKALDIYQTLRTTYIPTVHGRIVECYAVPFAILHAMKATPSPLEAEEALKAMLASKEGLTDIIPTDERELLRAIMESFVDLGGGHRRSVSQILHSEMLYNESREALERHGVALLSCRPGPRTYRIDKDARIFFNSTAVRRHLLRGTPWAELDIEQIFRRLDGAAYVQRRIDASRIRGIEIPAAGTINLDGVCPSAEEIIKGFDL